MAAEVVPLGKLIGHGFCVGQLEYHVLVDVVLVKCDDCLWAVIVGGVVADVPDDEHPGTVDIHLRASH
jgi:hypothetical protein